MKVYVFGNQDVAGDNQAIQLAEQLSRNFLNVNFEFIKPNQDLPFAGEEEVIIFDTVIGITKPEVFNERDLDNIVLSVSTTTVHDYDLGFQLKYLKKLGMIRRIKIIGVPVRRKVPYSSIHSIFKKLVAQDIQGS